MGYQPQTEADIQENLTEQLDWRFAERKDMAVAQALYTGEAVDAMHTLDEVGLLDGFFAFLTETGVLAHWQEFSIEAVKRVFLPTIYFVLLYGTRVLFGIESSNALPSLLFSNLAVMSLIGFTAYQVNHGLSQRGQAQRRGVREYVLMDPQTLADTICKSSAVELEKLFNGTIHCLAVFGLFMAEVMVAVDGTRVVTPPTYQGCGRLRVRQRQWQAGVEVTVIQLVYGWRLIALIDLVTLIPLAVKIVPIQHQEAPYLLALVQQAQVNLAPVSRIRWLVVDRAYVDGPTLYALERLGIRFVLIAKTNMAAYRTAVRFSQSGPIHERIEIRRHGHGRTQTTERLVTRVVAVQGIRSWRNYRPPKQAGRRLLAKNRPALNGLVILQWRNQEPTGGVRVYLTNAPVDQPWLIVDAYDDRSWIENGLFRNSKQFWRLSRWFPQKSEAGVRSHLTFVVMLIALATAYRLWQKGQQSPAQPEPTSPLPTYRLIDTQTGEVIAEPPPSQSQSTHLASPVLLLSNSAETETPATPILAHSLLGGQGPARWRRQLQQENRDKVIVFIGQHYGIFDTHELLVLLGVPVRDLPPQLGSPADILHRYGCSAPT